MATYRKHVFAYAPRLLRLCILAALLVCLFYFQPAKRLAAAMHMDPNVAPYAYLHDWGDPAFSLLLAVFVIAEVYRVVVLVTTSISVDGETVYYKSGFLPWSTQTRYWRSFQIFASFYSQAGFFGWLFSIGSVTITGKEGSTREFTVTWIWRPKRCSIEINDLVRG